MENSKNNTQSSQSCVSKSVLISGKCKTDFKKWFDEKCYDSFLEFEDLFSNNSEIIIIRNSLLFNFLDGRGINIVIDIDVNNNANSCDEYCENCDDCYDTWNPEFEYCIYVFDEVVNNLNTYHSYYCDDTFESRELATELAIIKANELYNEKVV